MQNFYSLVSDLNKLASKKDVGDFLLRQFMLLFKINYGSFVYKEEDELRVLSQMGDSGNGKNIFQGNAKSIYEVVMKKGDITILKFDSGDQFLFIPILDKQKKTFECGMFILNLTALDFVLSDELKEKIMFLCDVCALVLIKITNFEKVKLNNIEVKSNLDNSLLTKIHSAISGVNKNKKILFHVIEDANALANGKVWWVDDISSDITLVLIADVQCEGLSSALVNGYLIGLMKGLKAKADIALHPAQTLKYLNQELNQIFKDSALVINAWYGVFNLDARKVRFANANHPAPFMIGTEQQVTRLHLNDNSQASLGVNVNSSFTEGSLYVAEGSKLVIFTKDLLDRVENIGQKYDPHWLPQILETVGALSLSEMRKSLDNILSESSSGTASMESRLALLLEIPTI